MTARLARRSGFAWPSGSRCRSGCWCVVSVVGLVAGLIALSELGDARRRTVDRIDPAITAALRLTAAMLNEETGVRGYALTQDPAFLEPYARGRREERAAFARARRDAGRRSARGSSADVGAAAACRRRLAPDVRRAGDRRRARRPRHVHRRRPGERQAALRPPARDAGARCRPTCGASAARARADLALRRRGRDRHLHRLRRPAAGRRCWWRAGVLRGVVGRAARPPRRARADGRPRGLRPHGRRGRRARGGRARRRRRRDAATHPVRARGAGRHATTSSAPTPSSSSSPTSPRTTCRSRCARSPSFTQMLQRRYAGPARRARRPVHRLRRRRRPADAGPDQRPARASRASAASREPDVAVDLGRPRARRRATTLADRRSRRPAARVEVTASCRRCAASRRCCALVFQNLIGNGLKFRGDEPPRGARSAPRAASGEDDGASPSPTTASGSSRSTPTASSSSSSACTRARATRAPASGWRCAARSSSTTAAASGSTPSPGDGADLPASPCRSRDRRRARRSEPHEHRRGRADRGPARRGRPGRRRS